MFKSTFRNFYVIVLSAVLAAITSAFIWKNSTPPPEDALQHFYVYQGSEDMLMDPLILAGDKVVPLVLDKVKDKNMTRRRYAIGFLGNGAYTQAIPELKKILQDKAEDEVIRGDALQAIYQIDESLGLKYALEYKDISGFLGQVSADVLNGETYLKKRRSYFEALMSSYNYSCFTN